MILLICLKDISKKRKALNMHSMHSMHILGGWGDCCAVLYVFERYKQKTYSLEYAFYAFYAYLGGGSCCAVVYMFERFKQKTYSLEYAFYAIYAKYGGGGAVLYISLRDISKRCKGITPLLRKDCLLLS